MYCYFTDLNFCLKFVLDSWILSVRLWYNCQNLQVPPCSHNTRCHFRFNEVYFNCAGNLASKWPKFDSWMQRCFFPFAIFLNSYRGGTNLVIFSYFLPKVLSPPLCQSLDSRQTLQSVSDRVLCLSCIITLYIYSYYCHICFAARYLNISRKLLPDSYVYKSFFWSSVYRFGYVPNLTWWTQWISLLCGTFDHWS